MPGAILPISKKSKSALIAALSSFIVIVLLFYIDEGRFSFEFLFDPGGWIIIGIYLASCLLFQAITYFLILRKYKGDEKDLFTSLIGIPLGIGALIAVLYAIG